MSTIVTRAGKGSPLTNTEVDTNFTNLNTNKIQSGDTVASLDINGGTIDNTAIGGATPAAGAFTTLSASSTVTLSGGTANGVAYLDGSKVLTTSAALIWTGATQKLGFQNAAANGYGYIYNAGAGTNTDLAFEVGASEQMRLTSTGLGIGTSSPAEKLTVAATANNAARITSTASTTALVIDNTNANGWGGNLAINTGGVAAGYFGTIGSLLGSTSQDLAVYATAGNGFRVYTNGNNERLRLDSSGNLGLGVTPSAWTTYSAFQLGAQSSLAGNASFAILSQNWRYDGADRYIATAAASQYYQGNGAHVWRTAPSGTAGNAISFTQAMTLDASGRLMVGMTSGANAALNLQQIGGVNATLFNTTNDAYTYLINNGSEFRIQNSYGSTAGQKPITFWASGGENVRIDSSGNVGIGTSSPNVGGASTNYTTFTVSGRTAGYAGIIEYVTPNYPFVGGEIGFTKYFNGTNENARVTVRPDGNYNDNAYYAISTKPTGGFLTERMRIDSSGNLLIGYTSSNGSYKLQVNSQIFATNATIATSDGRYKENIQSLDGALNLVSQLNPVQFSWKEHPVHNFDLSGPTIGFIAQEVEQVLADKPYLNSIIKRNECVIEPEEKDAEGNVTKEAVTEEFLGIAEGNMIALLTKALQELKADFDAYKASHP